MKRANRILAAGLAALGLALLLAFGALVAALGTGWGTRWSLDLAQRLLPELEMENIDGDWLDGLHIGALRWNTPDTGLAITDLNLRLRWLQLLNSQLRLHPLNAADIRLVLRGESKDEPVQLPTLWMPVPLQASLNVERLTIESEGTETVLRPLRGNLRWLGSTLRFSQLSLGWEELSVAADGRLQFQGDYPLQVRASLNHPQLPEALAANLSGSLRKLRAQATLGGLWPVAADAEVALLDEHLPLSGNVRLQRPVTQSLAGEQVQLRAGAVKLNGNLEQLQGELALDIEEPRYGNSHLVASWRWQPQQLQIAPRWQLPQGQAQADCAIALADLSWQCEGGLDGVPLTPWLQVVEGELSGPLRVDGQWAGGKLRLNLEMPEFSGRLASEAISGDLQLDTDDAELWQLPRFTLIAGPNQLGVRGSFGSRNHLDIDLSAGDLSRLYPALAGSANATVSARGSWPNPDLSGDLRARQLRYENLQVGVADASFDIARLGLDDSRIRIDLNELVAAGQPPFSIDLTANGTRAEHRLALNANQRDNSRAELNCSGLMDQDFRDWRLNCPQLRGAVKNDRSQIAWKESKPVRARWQIAAGQLEVSPFCLTGDGAELCLDKPLRYRNRKLEPFDAHGRDLPLAWLRPYLPDSLSLINDAKASAQLSVRGLAPFKLNAGVQVSESQWQWLADEKPQQATLQNFAVEAQLDEQRAELSASVSSPTLGSFSSQLTVLDPRGRRELTGEIAIRQLQVGGFAWLVSGLDTLGGQVDGRIAIAGEAAALRLQGQMELVNGVVGWAPLGDLVRDIHLSGRFDNNSADFKGGFGLGGGTGNLDGSLHWQGDDANLWDLRMQVDASKITIAPLPDSEVVLAPKVAVQITPFRFVTTGRIDIDSADIKVKELPPETVRVSPDQEIVGEKPKTHVWQMLTDVQLNLGNQFHFSGFGADVDLRGGLHLQRDASQLFRANGEVKVADGRYRAYGQRLLVRRGSFIFTGPWDNPDLNLEAIRELPPSANPTNAVVGIKVSGPLRSPNAMLFSEPGMPESDIAYYILTGQPRAAPQANQFSTGGTLLALGLAGSGEQAGRLAKQFGIGDFQIGTVAGAGGTEAEMSGYLTPQLYVRYGRGLLQRSNTITFQYRLTPRLLIETVSGIEDALDLLYSFTIK